MPIKNLLMSVLAAAIFGLAPNVMADDARPLRCSNKTLKGTYQLFVSGSVASGAGTYIPDTYAGFVSYDGRGNVLLKKTFFSAGEWGTTTSIGIYSIGSDCVGTATYPGAAEFRYFVAPDGDSLSVVKVANYVGAEFIPSPDRMGGTLHRVSTKIIAQPPG